MFFEEKIHDKDKPKFIVSLDSSRKSNHISTNFKVLNNNNIISIKNTNKLKDFDLISHKSEADMILEINVHKSECFHKDIYFNIIAK